MLLQLAAVSPLAYAAVDAEACLHVLPCFGACVVADCVRRACVQCFFLTRRHRRALADMGAASYHVEQHEDETIYVPAGCPHQVTAHAAVAQLYRIRSHANGHMSVSCSLAMPLKRRHAAFDRNIDHTLASSE